MTRKLKIECDEISKGTTFRNGQLQFELDNCNLENILDQIGLDFILEYFEFDTRLQAWAQAHGRKVS